MSAGCQITDFRPCIPRRSGYDGTNPL